MTWTQISDELPERLEHLGLSRGARLLHIEATVWANKLLTDGLIPRRRLPRITDSENLEDEVVELVSVGLWVERDDGYQVDWTDQESSETVRRRREQARVRKRRHREHKQGNHEYCDPRSVCRTRDETRDGTGSATAPQPLPSSPFPPQPEGAGGGKDGLHVVTRDRTRDGTRQRCSHGRPLAVDGSGCEQCAASPEARTAT